MRTDLFVSYSHKDSRYQERLVTQLRVLEKAGRHRLRVWSDQQIPPGGDWQEAIDSALESAASAVLLISANFLTSNFILEREVPAILKRHEEAGLRVFPVIATPCAWKKVDWLASIQPRPRDGNPVWRSGGRYADVELARLVEEIADLLSDTVTPATPVAAVIEGADPIPWIDEYLAPARPVSLTEIAGALQAAITRGVPLFNTGRTMECANLYLQTTQTLIERIEETGCDVTIPKMRSAESMLGTLSTRDPLNLAGCTIAAKILEVAAVPAPAIDSTSATRIAWSLRYAFDQILMLEESLSTLTDLARKVPPRPDRPPTDARAFGILIQRALMLGDQAYLAGRHCGQHWWHAVAATYYHAARHAADFVDDDMGEHDVLVDVFHGKLYSKNEAAFCWELRGALLRLLSARH
jgi:hypothetical protein